MAEVCLLQPLPDYCRQAMTLGLLLSFLSHLEKLGMCGDGVGMTLCFGRREALIGLWWVWEALANLVHELIVKAAAERGGSLRVFRWGEKVIL